MATHTWNYDRAKKRIDAQIDAVKDVEILEYTKERSLKDLSKKTAVRMDAVHVYADILNLDDILETTDTEGVRSHQRALRFLNQHYRAVHRILHRCEALRVDFHNQRLHSVVARPYNSETDGEAKRVRRAVAIAQLIIDVLKETGDEDESIPSAVVAVGIDTGKALAVNNGRNGGREPLFLGRPANHAAKHAASEVAGIFLTAESRAAIGLKAVADTKATALTQAEIKDCQERADLGVTKESIVAEWREDMKNSPIGDFVFSGHTPPMKDLKITDLSPKNSRRQELLSIYADIDNFTQYVTDHIDDNPEDVVRTLHVLRSELDCALTSDFEGRRIRFIGDCIHGVICEGTAQTTDTEASITDVTRAVGALRSSFDLSKERLDAAGVESGDLALSIGFEYGPTSISRLGMRGDRVRCCISRSVLKSEEEQCRCSGTETAIGPVAYKKATQAVREVFGKDRKVAGLDYAEATERLAERGEASAKAAKVAAYQTAAPAIVLGINRGVRPHCRE